MTTLIIDTDKFIAALSTESLEQLSEKLLARLIRVHGDIQIRDKIAVEYEAAKRLMGPACRMVNEVSANNGVFSNWTCKYANWAKTIQKITRVDRHFDANGTEAYAYNGALWKHQHHMEFIVPQFALTIETDDVRLLGPKDLVDFTMQIVVPTETHPHLTAESVWPRPAKDKSPKKSRK